MNMPEIGISVLLRWLRGGGWKWLAGAMTALAIGYLAWSFVDTRHKLSDARTTIEAQEGEIALLRRVRDADEASDKVRVIYRDRATTEATKRQDKINEALAASPDWANQPLPPGIADSLQ